jgi:hypothetical protein
VRSAECRILILPDLYSTGNHGTGSFERRMHQWSRFMAAPAQRNKRLMEFFCSTPISGNISFFQLLQQWANNGHLLIATSGVSPRR